MHSYAVIMGVLNARREGIAFATIQQRYGIGVKGIYLILNRFEVLNMDFEEFSKWEPEKVVEAIYPPE